MSEHGPLVGQAGDTGEAEVLREAAESLTRFSRRLPAGSPWAEVLLSVAEGFYAGGRLSQMRADRAA